MKKSKWEKETRWTKDFNHLSTATIIFDGKTYAWRIIRRELDFGFGDCDNIIVVGEGVEFTLRDAKDRVKSFAKDY